jgi:hypothetical protein
MASKREKIEALLDSPVAGERDAAAEALRRLRSNRKPMPPPRLPQGGINPAFQEWSVEENRRLNRMAKWANSQLSVPEARDRLSIAEQKMVRNCARWGISAPMKEPHLSEFEDRCARLGWTDA